ncbi:MAG: hypothetical protein ACFFBL_10665, partial [Promethearchaeota archaeon]
LIILTLVMTYQSIWILQYTFGMGWLTANETRILWVLMLCAYVVIAWAEEMHLEKQFGQEWTDYRRGKGFLLPSLYFNSYILEALIAIIIPYLVLEAWLSLAPIPMEALIIL